MASYVKAPTVNVHIEGITATQLRSALPPQYLEAAYCSVKTPKGGMRAMQLFLHSEAPGNEGIGLSLEQQLGYANAATLDGFIDSQPINEVGAEPVFSAFYSRVPRQLACRRSLRLDRKHWEIKLAKGEVYVQPLTQQTAHAPAQYTSPHSTLEQSNLLPVIL